MRKRIIIGCILAYLVLTMAVCVETPTAQDYSPFNPAPVGVPVTATVECGDPYAASELYNLKITVQEIIRGKEALKRIKAASMSDQPTKADSEYILARIRFEFFARGAPGDKDYDLREDQFVAVSSDGREYDAPSIVQPKLILSSRLHSGDSLEGWLAFQVAQDDNKPLMLFNRGGIWFKLY
jgi:hypothetical protein